ncbi:hypothetical protein [Flavobacterium sp.]|uniref:hypothetical protein n=1 Tax=Flavobacterium sp. TaxID=239 RepID=UPI0038FC1894
MIKKLSNKIYFTFLPLCLVILLSISCSSDNKDPTILFTSLKANKEFVFTEDPIVLSIDGTGYTTISVTSTNPAISITKATSTSYEIKSTVATTAYIYVELTNNANKEFKYITLNFYEHGVKDYTTVEGIKVNYDGSAKVLALLGEPDKKLDSSTGTLEYWNYGSKGLNLTIIKSSSVVESISILSSNFIYTNSSNVQTNYTNYPYEIGNSWKINNSSTTMDMIVSKLGLPTIKGTSTTSLTLRYYQYSTQKLIFRFYSDSEDNYTGKKIINFVVY